MWNVSFCRVLWIVLVMALTPCASAFAEVVAVQEDNPKVTIDVEAPFETSETSRGVQLKTSDGEVYVWFETYDPADFEALVAEHNKYWGKNDVAPGDETEQYKKEFGNKSVVATDFKGATWKGKPTVVRYLSIDAGLPSKRLILMSLWASPEGDKAHDAEISTMLGTLKIEE